MSSPPQDHRELEQAFHDTAEAEDAAFLKGQGPRKVAALVLLLAAVLAGGALVGWAVFAATR
jgi:hypothetical protein